MEILLKNKLRAKTSDRLTSRERQTLQAKKGKGEKKEPQKKLKAI